MDRLQQLIPESIKRKFRAKSHKGHHHADKELPPHHPIKLADDEVILAANARFAAHWSSNRSASAARASVARRRQRAMQANNSLEQQPHNDYSPANQRRRISNMPVQHEAWWIDYPAGPRAFSGFSGDGAQSNSNNNSFRTAQSHQHFSNGAKSQRYEDGDTSGGSPGRSRRNAMDLSDGARASLLREIRIDATVDQREQSGFDVLGSMPWAGGIELVACRSGGSAEVRMSSS